MVATKKTAHLGERQNENKNTEDRCAQTEQTDMRNSKTEVKIDGKKLAQDLTESLASAVDEAKKLSRIPDGIDVGTKVYIKLSEGAAVRADKIKEIIIRAAHTSVVLQSGKEIKISDLGKKIFLSEEKAK